MDRDIIISKESISGYNRLVNLKEERYLFNGKLHSSLLIGFSYFDRDLAIKVSNDLFHNTDLVQVKGRNIFKDSLNKRWVRSGLEEGLSVLFKECYTSLLINYSYLCLLNSQDTEDKILSLFKNLKDILISSNTKVFVEDLTLPVRWCMVNIGRYLNDSLKDEFVSINHFLYG